MTLYEGLIYLPLIELHKGWNSHRQVLLTGMLEQEYEILQPPQSIMVC